MTDDTTSRARLRPRRAWPLLGLLTLLTYNTWLLAVPLTRHPQIFQGYLSDQSASDQPFHLFFRIGDNLTALVVGALGVRAVRTWPRRPDARAGWWLLAASALLLFAVSTFFDSFLSMDCSPTLSDSCRVLEEEGKLSFTHYAHTYSSVGAETGIVASMVSAYIASRRTNSGGSWWPRLLLAVCVAEVGSLAVMMVMLAAGMPGIGYLQAAMVAAASVWFAAVGVALGRSDHQRSVPAGDRREDAHADRS